MTDNRHPDLNTPADPVVATRKRPFIPPRLIRQGDLRSLTLGGSLGTDDSGNTGLQKPPA